MTSSDRGTNPVTSSEPGADRRALEPLRRFRRLLPVTVLSWGVLALASGAVRGGQDAKRPQPGRGALRSGEGAASGDDRSPRGVGGGAPGHRMDGLLVDERDDGSTTLRLVGSSKPTFNVYRMGGPDRLVVDIANSARGTVVPHVPLDTWACGRVTVDEVEERGAQLVRTVVELKRESSYIVVLRGHDLYVTVTPREAPPEAYFARRSAAKRREDLEKETIEVQNLRKQASTLESEARALHVAATQKSENAERALKAASTLEATAKAAEARARTQEAALLQREEAARRALDDTHANRGQVKKALKQAAAERAEAEAERERAKQQLAEATRKRLLAERALSESQRDADRKREEAMLATERARALEAQAKTMLEAAKLAQVQAAKDREVATSERQHAKKEHETAKADRHQALRERETATQDRTLAAKAKEVAETERLRAEALFLRAEDERRRAVAERDEAAKTLQVAQAAAKAADETGKQTAAGRAQLALAQAEQAKADARLKGAEVALEKRREEHAKHQAEAERAMAREREAIAAEKAALLADRERVERAKVELDRERKRTLASHEEAKAALAAREQAVLRERTTELSQTLAEKAQAKRESEVLRAQAAAERSRLEAEHKAVLQERERVARDREKALAELAAEKARVARERDAAVRAAQALAREREAALARSSAATRGREAAEAGRRELEKLRSAALEEERRAKLARTEAEAAQRDAVAAREAATRAQTSAAEAMRQAEEERRQAELDRANAAGDRQALAALREAAEREKGELERARKQATEVLVAASSALVEATERRQVARRDVEAAKQALAQAKQRSPKETDPGRNSATAAAIRAAESTYQAANARLRGADEALAKLRSDTQALEKTLSAKRREQQQIEQRLAQKAGDLRELEAQVATVRKRREAQEAEANREVDAAQSRVRQAELRRAVLGKEVTRLGGLAEAAGRKVQEAEQQLATLRAQKDQDAAKRVAQRRAVEESLAAAKREQVALAGQVTDKRERLTTLEQEVDRLRSELETQRAAHTALASEDARLRERHERTAQSLAAKEAELARTQAALSQETDRLAKVRSAVDDAKHELAETLAAKPVKVATASEAEARPVRVKAVRFEHQPDAETVIVDLEGVPDVRGQTLSPELRQLHLRHAVLDRTQERSLDTAGYGGPVAMVSSFGEGDDVKIVVSSRRGVEPVLEEKPGRLVWRFPLPRGSSEPVTLAGTKVGGFQAPRAVTAQSAMQEPATASPEPRGARAERGPGPGGGPQASKSKWRGERIDIELQDAPIKDVLLLFSDIGRVNIIAGRGVAGTVTMKLTAVPWDQALDIILRSLNLGMTREGNVIRVATIDDLEAERRKAIERANAQIQLKPLETRLVPVSYATVEDMIPKVQSVLSSRGSVTPDARTSTLIIMDVAENIALAEQLVGQLDSQTPQVLIEARIVEARTNFLRQLGIQWGFGFTASPGTGNATGILFPNSLGVAGGATGQAADKRGLILPASFASPNYAVDLPAPVGTGAGGAVGFSFGSIGGNLNTNLRLSAAEDTGEVRIISAPKIVTLDNMAAQIEQGVQIPISQVSAQGVNTRYVNATLALSVTPHVTNEGAVRMDVRVQKNEADFINTGARGDPTILTKQAQSQMLVNDGDTAVIGGIYTRNKSLNYKKVPWLADIPIVGWFFKNRSEADTRTEVLIFLTPKIVNRASSIGGG